MTNLGSEGPRTFGRAAHRTFISEVLFWVPAAEAAGQQKPRGCCWAPVASDTSVLGRERAFATQVRAHRKERLAAPRRGIAGHA